MIPLVNQLFDRPEILSFSDPARSVDVWVERMRGAARIVHFFADGRIPLAALDLVRPAEVIIAGPPAGCIDVSGAKEMGVTVRGRSGLTVNAVAEFTLAGLLTSMRRGAAPGLEAAEAVLGIVGYGAIGREVARKARDLFMKVVVCSESLTRDVASRQGVVKVELDELAAKSDAISIHLRSVGDGAPRVGAQFLERVQVQAVLVNTSRQSVLDLDAVHRALQDGRLRAVLLDATPSEIPAGHPILTNPAVDITQHLAWRSATAMRTLIQAALADLRAGVQD